jgi:uncharacterized protein (TIGR03437 family)
VTNAGPYNATVSGLFFDGNSTVTPPKSGFSFTTSSSSVTINRGDLTGINFTAVNNPGPNTITIDTQVRKDQSMTSSSVTSPTFSTGSGHELLLAFIAAAYQSGVNTSVRSVAGAGLTWVPVLRTGTQTGTAEIWRAFSPSPLSSVSVSATLSQSVTSSMTVMSFAGVDTSGTNGSGAIGATGRGNGSAGAPAATLVTTRNNSLIVGVGDDPSVATARTPGPGQTLVHQYLDPAGNTFWVQTLSGPTRLSGTSVTVNDLTPTADPYNLSIVEILADLSGGAPTPSGAIPLMSAAMSRDQVAPSKQDNSSQTSSESLILSDLAGRYVTNACSPGGTVALNVMSFPFPLQLGGLQVDVNGIPAPLLSAAGSRVTFQCPWLAPGTPLDISLEGPNGISRSVGPSVMRETAPELFTLDATNQGVVLLGATNEIAMLKTEAVASRPAQRGEYLTVYASGLGEFADRIPAGSPILLKNRIRVVVGGIEIDPAFAGYAPGTVGLSQVDAQLPSSVPAGPAVPLYIEAILGDGTVIQSNEVTVAIE